MTFLTLDDVETASKRVLLRIDVNSPVSESGKIMDTSRFEQHLETIRELQNSKLVIMSHQGRPGDDDFTTLEQHAEILSEMLGKEVEYIDDIFGPAARERIKKLEDGEILMLENVRFYSEEILNRPPERQALTPMVQKLSPLFDLFVNDAFSTAHRSQPSMVGFSVTLPSVAGRLMEREVKALSRVVKNPERPVTFVLGGRKYEDSIEVIESALSNRIADRILTCGMVGNVFLAVKHGIDEKQLGFEIKRAVKDKVRQILRVFEDRIEIPVDVAYPLNGSRHEMPVETLPIGLPIWDIGSKTIEKYRKVIRESGTVVANGPAGRFEDPDFGKGTLEILEAIAESRCFSVLGGGHLIAAASKLGLLDKFSYVSTSGGALLTFVSGKPLPAVIALEKAAERFGRR
ncbi:MAG: phosphoglycerate kinase [Archaeoglobi archaeon]|nr:phosphoglycerate kinase [Candidatus Mnemosynella bozhongmuii]